MSINRIKVTFERVGATFLTSGRNLKRMTVAWKKITVRVPTWPYSCVLFQFHHRDPGLLGLLATECEGNTPIYFGLINDGCHTHPEAVRIVYRTNYEGIAVVQSESSGINFSVQYFSKSLNISGLVLVTDAISAIGLEDGVHRIGALEIEIKNKCAYILGTKTLCGSITTLNRCVQLLDEYTSKCYVLFPYKLDSVEPRETESLFFRLRLWESQSPGSCLPAPCSGTRHCRPERYSESGCRCWYCIFRRQLRCVINVDWRALFLWAQSPFIRSDWINHPWHY